MGGRKRNVNPLAFAAIYQDDNRKTKEQMIQHSTRRIALGGLLAIMAGMAFAAPVVVQPRDEYTRLLFPFDQPTTLNVGGGGQSVILNFSQPVDDSASNLQAKLGTVVLGVQQSADGHQLVLNLAKNYRVRQFISGNTVGIDIMMAAADPAPEKPAAEAPTAIAPTPAAANPMLTTKNTAPAPAPAAPPAAAPPVKPEAPAPQANPILTTKKPPAPEAPAPRPAKDTPPPPAPAPSAPAAPAAPAPAAALDEPFLVGVQPTKGGTLLEFPWKGRVAAAVFERGNDIWISFNRSVDVNAALLRTVMPTSVIKLDQFAYPSATVLRLTTDGSLHATASQPEKSYHWRVSLNHAAPHAALDIPVSGERDERDASYLLLRVFDVAEPLSFYDPQFGDLLMVVPAYEVGRGMASTKATPELTLLPTQQGVAIVSRRDALQTTRDREGLKILGTTGLAVSENLPTLAPDATPTPGTSPTSRVMIPYDKWFVAPEDFATAEQTRMAALINASADARAEALLSLVRLYLGKGMGVESEGYLEILQKDYPNFYTENKLALLHAAANFMSGRLQEALQHISAPELADQEEATLWREAITLSQPQAMNFVPPLPPAEDAAQEAAKPPAPTAPVPVFDYMAYDKSFIHFYPPLIRQRLALLAGDRYLRANIQDKALKVYESLNRDGILGPVQPYAELTLANIAIHKNKIPPALAALDRLSQQPNDLYVQARARYDAILLRLEKKMIKPAEAIEQLERLHMAWRGDGLERQLLMTLAALYQQSKQYDMALRTYQNVLQSFPGDPDTLTIAGDMADMFQRLFLDGTADEMSPLKSLALFYEFRALTPIGPRGDAMIQKLADRLASVDLLDRATQLLERQIRYRLSGEERARVGARLALLYLLDKQPQRALEVLDITNYGGMDGTLQRERLQLAAQALSANGTPEEALSLLYHDESESGSALRLEILWNMQDWPNVVNTAEDMLSSRPDLTARLNERETAVLLKLALGYSFEHDPNQLRYLRDYYMGLMPEGPFKEIFDYITNDTAPLDTEDFAMVAQQINRTESFLDAFRKKIANGQLSDVASEGGDTPETQATPAQQPAPAAQP
jgi:outer membrane protein assembly factor BamD (BamD/ComL family)